MFHTYNKVLKVAPSSAAATTFSLAAGTTTVTSSSVDLATDQAKEIVFLLHIGTITATGTGVFKVQGSDDNSTFVDIAGTAQSYADTDSDKTIAVEIVKPTYRYYRVSIARATANSVITLLQAVVTDLRTEPSRVSTATGQYLRAPEIFASPVAGTA